MRVASSSRGRTPARTSDDFPLPEAPTTATTRPGASRAGELFDEFLSTEEQLAVRGLEGGQTRIWRPATGRAGRRGRRRRRRGGVRARRNRRGGAVPGRRSRRPAGRSPVARRAVVAETSTCPASAQRADAGDSTESGSGIAAVGDDGFAGVRGAVDLDPTAGQVALEVDAGPDRVAGAMEHRHAWRRPRQSPRRAARRGARPPDRPPADVRPAGPVPCRAGPATAGSMTRRRWRGR